MKKKLLIIILFLALHSVKAQSWRAAGLGANFNIETFLTDSNNKLYVGGSFTTIDGLPRTAIAVWDSIQWNNFGNNSIFRGTISCMTFYNGELIVGGSFDSINNMQFNNVAKWNGTNWQRLGNGFDNTVYTLQVYHNQLYAGGSFDMSGVDTIGHLGKWNGSSWQKGVTSINGYVFSSTLFKDKLLIGGQFSQINGSSIYRVASYNDTVWSNLNIVLNNQVYKVKNIDDTLYVSGNFTQIAGYPFNYICRYDGSTWTQIPYPLGTTQNITDIEKYNSKLYLCGNLDNPDDLYLLNGLNCDSVGSSNGFYVCMTTYKNELYVGGNFLQVGSQPANCLAIYNDDINSGLDELQNEKITFYPNPISKKNISELKFKLVSGINIKSVSIYSIDGKIVQDSNYKDLSLDELTEGVYVILIKTSDNKTFTKKLILTT